MSSSSPQHHRSGDRGNNGRSSVKEERPTFFDFKAKAETVPGRHPERWRKDAAGNIVCKRFCNWQGCLCFEYDDIIPYSKGGESVAENCQILQTKVNGFKSDKDQVNTTQLQGYSCDIKFTVLPWIKDIRCKKMMHHQILQLVKYLCSTVNDSNDPDYRMLKSSFLSAAQNGIDEVVKEILKLLT